MWPSALCGEPGFLSGLMAINEGSGPLFGESRPFDPVPLVATQNPPKMSHADDHSLVFFSPKRSPRSAPNERVVRTWGCTQSDPRGANQGLPRLLASRRLPGTGFPWFGYLVVFFPGIVLRR